VVDWARRDFARVLSIVRIRVTLSGTVRGLGRWAPVLAGLVALLGVGLSSAGSASTASLDTLVVPDWAFAAGSIRASA
jgi:hypothetical protein